MWEEASAAARAAPTPISALLLASLNDMFDRSLTNRRNFDQHVPAYLLRLLLVASLISVGAMGYHFGLVRSRNLIITWLLLGLWTSAMVLIVDIDRSRSGSVRMDMSPLDWTIQGLTPPGPAP